MEEIQWLRKIGMLEYIFHLWSVYPPPTYITLEVYQINVYLGFPNEYVAFYQDGCTPYTKEREQTWLSKDFFSDKYILFQVNKFHMLVLKMLHFGVFW